MWGEIELLPLSNCRRQHSDRSHTTPHAAGRSASASARTPSASSARPTHSPLRCAARARAAEQGFIVRVRFFGRLPRQTRIAATARFKGGLSSGGGGSSLGHAHVATRDDDGASPTTTCRPPHKHTHARPHNTKHLAGQVAAGDARGRVQVGARRTGGRARPPARAAVGGQRDDQGPRAGRRPVRLFVCCCCFWRVAYPWLVAVFGAASRANTHTCKSHTPPPFQQKKNPTKKGGASAGRKTRRCCACCWAGASAS